MEKKHYFIVKYLRAGILKISEFQVIVIADKLYTSENAAPFTKGQWFDDIGQAKQKQKQMKNQRIKSMRKRIIELQMQEF